MREPDWQYPILSEAKSLGERDWGKEELLESSPGSWTLKRLFIKAGRKGGLQYHRKKDEGGYLVTGKMLIRYGKPGEKLQETIITSGMSFRFPSYSIHQEEAITDCLIIEVSNPYLNDRVRVESEFGLPSNGGLQSTAIEDIIII